MKISPILSHTVALASLFIAGVGAVNAQDISPVISSHSGSPGDVTYVYNVFLGLDTRVSPGEQITFYDYNGLLTGGADTPTFSGLGGASYTITTPLLGANPPNTTQLAGDDPTLQNVTLTYNGVTLANGTATQELLGTLTLHSANAENTVGDFTAFAANSIKDSNGTPSGNQAFVFGPNLGPAATTPEPGTWAMLLGMGVSGAAFARRRTRRH